MQPHQQRVVDEKFELDGRLEKLTIFMDGDIFDGLPEEEQDRLERQFAAMTDYSAVLGERIAAFPPPAQTIIP